MLSGGFDDRTVLDIGSAAGTEMDFLFLEKCRSLVGVDISKEMLKWFLERTPGETESKKIFLVTASAEYLPFRQQVFDNAAIFHTLHHCPNQQKVMEEMVRASKGIILLEPNRESVVHRIAYFIRSLQTKRFSVTNFSEKLVEFQTLGFLAKEIKNNLAYIGMTKTYASATGILPTWFPLPHLIARCVLKLEDLIQKIPILKWQLGAILIVAKRDKSSNILFERSFR